MGKCQKNQANFDLTSYRILYTINGNRIGGLLWKKYQMTTPLVEMDGDEMTRILWKMIKR